MQDKDLRYSVYIHEMPNGKRYVGATTDVNERFKPIQYVGNKAFYEDIKLYGWENINHIVVKSDMNYREASQLEQDMIAKYNTTNPECGYNVHKGGRLKQRKKYPSPAWSKKVQKRMVDVGMTKKQLANKLNRNYTQLVCVMNGKRFDDTIAKEICNYFGMEM